LGTKELAEVGLAMAEMETTVVMMDQMPECNNQSTDEIGSVEGDAGE